MKKLNLQKIKWKVLAVPAIALGLLLSCADTKVDESTIVKDVVPRENTTGFIFPVGYESFDEDPSINYLLNRLYSIGYAPADNMIRAGELITDFPSVRVVMEDLAEEAAREGRHMNAAFYYRAAEFYTKWDEPGKLPLYDQFIEQFYLAVEMDRFETGRIEYKSTSISTLRVEAELPEPKGTIILHAGYDAFKEELYSGMRFLASQGYDVIGFDVPWMDRSAKPDDEGFSYEWERVIGAVLDHYGVADASLIGISFGGWLALRAAAFEPRISRVVASSVSYDVNQYVSWFNQKIAQFALRRMKGFTNKQIVSQMESDPQSAWFFDQLMHVTRRETPLEAAEVLSQINARNLHSELVTQDVLILTGADDQLVPFKMHNLQVKALVNAASVTPLVFTGEVHGEHHCQIGNFGLALTTILNWLDETD